MRKLLFVLIPFLIFAQQAPVKYGSSNHWKTIQVKGANVYVADTNVPTVVGKTSMGDVIAGASLSTGQDIVITTSNGALVPRTISSFSKTDSTFQMHYRDPATHATTGGTVLYVQWGGATVADDATTWSSNYGGSINHALVVHGEEAAADLTDESGNHTSTDANMAYDKTGKILKAPEYNGTNSVNDWGAFTELNSIEKFTFMTWCNQDIANIPDYMMDKGASTNRINIQTFNDNKLYFIIGAGTLANCTINSYASIFPAGSFSHLSIIFDGSQAGNARAKYAAAGVVASFDGYSNTPPATTGAMGTNALKIGNSSGLNSAWDGKLDETRIVIGALSQNQLKGQYDNQNGFATNATLTIGATKTFQGNLLEKKSFGWMKSWSIFSRRFLRHQ